jgi:hypothetical protein
VIGNALPDSEVKCITPADIIASMSYFFNLLIDILSRTTRSILDKPIRNWFCNSSPTERKRRLPKW